MNDEKKYPISEIFVSPQGEGVYAGAIMAFIRLAGCTVGKPYPKKQYGIVDGQTHPIHPTNPWLPPGHLLDRILPIYTERCQLYDRRSFPCDTDYRVKERLTATEIKHRIPGNVRRVCITGGEPCMHDLSPLLTSLYGIGKQIHLETSGTIEFFSVPVWVTVSPKLNYLMSMIERADELKLLVDDEFEPYVFLDWASKKPVYLHPVNEEHTVNSHNLQLCRDWQDKYPQYRIGLQLHKAISMITNKHVR